MPEIVKMSSGPAILLLAAIGGLFLLTRLYAISRFLLLHFLTPRKPLSKYKRPGPEPTYALVTGASAGLGLGTAAALVRQGFGVILLGHLPDQLASAAASLRSEYGSEHVRTLVLNAQTATPAEIENAVASIAHLRLGILVNNVGGLAPPRPDVPPFRPLWKYDAAAVDAVIDLNARFMARLTAVVIPLLSRRDSQSQARSLIINMSSGSIMGTPQLVMYCATKAFGLTFSMALARELAMEPETAHIDSLAVVPGDVRTEGNIQLPKGTIKADAYGRLLVSGVDNALTQGLRWTSSYWLHDIQAWIANNVLTEGMRSAFLTAHLRTKAKDYNAAWERDRKKQ
jgi:17beta-estradiol 17-dehydrogenase / very-long-chain 3-oxoacyl-CoA reductase